MRKWNFKKQKYEPYSVPDEWNTPLISWDMEQIINCASCGKKMTFGDGYTSRKIHTEHGMGYNVCFDCYEKEWQEEMSYK